MKKRFQELSHTADVILRVYGTSMEELFKNACTALSFVLKKGKFGKLTQRRAITTTSSDPDFLIVDFLNDVLYYSTIHKEVYREIEIKALTDQKIEAEAHGEKIDGFDKDVKAVTYHNLEIKRVKGGYCVDIVLDV